MSVKADNNRRSGNELWAALRIRTVCLWIFLYVCVCVHVLSNIVFVGLDASFPFRGK